MSSGPQPRLTRHQLEVLADLARGRSTGHEAVLPGLRAIGAVDGDELAPGWVPLSRAAAVGRAMVMVARLRAGRRVVVEIRCGPEGIVAVPEAPPHEPVDVAVQPPWAMARTVWRVAQLSGGRQPLALDIADLDAPGLLAPFSASGGGWTSEPATLTRIDLELPGVQTVTLAVVDTGTHLAEVEGDAARGFVVRPYSPAPLFAALCGWQRALAGLEPPGDPPAATRTEDVALPDGQRLRLAVGDNWAPVPAATPVWAAPAEEGFAPNVVVTAAPGPVPADTSALREDLASALPDLRVVDIVRTGGGGLRSTAVHPTTGRDAVTVQERRPVAGATVAVAYTCAAEQYPTWRNRFTAWLVATC